ncbi:NAD(P)-dependent oxidoreductase [Chitinimonas arctica]|uniref:NAD(P)-dependent oxidoreductase n=2 Tax=Chitinimonas arctica TaxID=2594795 RepID=A0A516SMD2_9NEIS|nr:NAD(P)-dependent oxidoreductase [Chitinimonas arctica]
MARLGMVGATGLMGHGIARNLLAAGHALGLTVRGGTERVDDLLAAGASRVASLSELAAGAEVIFICVTGSPQVEQVIVGEGGLLAGARAGLVLVDCSTSEPDSTARLREICARKDVILVDAPLGRTPQEAEAGKLNIMVGCEPAVLQRLEPLLRCFAENVFHVGGPGAGHVVKLLNNFIGQSICTATAEAFAIGQRAGVDPVRLVEMMSAGPVNSPLFQAMAKTLGGELSSLRFELDNARKDVRYYLHMAENMGLPSMVGAAVHQSLSVASALGYGKKYVTSLVEAQERLTGAKLVPKSV